MSTESRRILSEIEKEFGKDVLVNGSRILDKKRKVISVSPAVNIALGGGIPEGSFVTIGGTPKRGKTTLALQFAKNWQQAGPNKEVYYGNVEHRLKEMNLKSCIGLDMERFHVIQSTKEKILSAQDFLRIFSSILKTQPEVLIIVDSFAMLSEEREQVGGVGTETRGGGNKLLAQFFREIASVVPINNSVVVGVTHMMANTSGYGFALQEKGGFGVAYQADVKLMAKAEELWMTGAKTGTLIGKKVKWLCEVSALGPPMGEAIGYHRFGKGIDEVMESLEVSCDLGLITKKGSHYYPVFLGEEKSEEYKCHGAQKLYDFFEEHAIYKEQLLNELQKLLGVKNESDRS